MLILMLYTIAIHPDFYGGCLCNPVAEPFQTFVREIQKHTMDKTQRLTIIRLAASIALAGSAMAINLPDRVNILFLWRHTSSSEWILYAKHYEI